MRVSVKDFGDRTEILFPCRVPNLQFDEFVLNPDGEGIELDADGDVALNKFIFDQPLEHA